MPRPNFSTPATKQPKSKPRGAKSPIGAPVSTQRAPAASWPAGQATHTLDTVLLLLFPTARPAAHVGAQERGDKTQDSSFGVLRWWSHSQPEHSRKSANAMPCVACRFISILAVLVVLSCLVAPVSYITCPTCQPAECQSLPGSQKGRTVTVQVYTAMSLFCVAPVSDKIDIATPVYAAADI